MKKYLVALAMALSIGCLPSKTVVVTPTAPVLIEGRDAEFEQVCAALYLQELGRPIDEAGNAACVTLAKQGNTATELTIWLRSSDEYAARQARLAQEELDREAAKAKLRGRLRVEGTKLVDASGQTFTPKFASVLTALAADEAPLRALLAQLQEDGFNGFRVFAGRLTWAGQSVDLVYQRLDGLLNMAAEYGFYVQVTAVTDSRDGGYSIREHVRRVADITAAHENVLFEVGNELYHGTQADAVNDVSGFCAMSRELLAGYPNPWGLGAGAEDAPVNGRYSADCGPMNFVHLRRGKERDMLDALWGLADIMIATGKPVINSEPMGAAEVERPGARIANPGFFREMAHVGASFGFGAVFHSEDGLFARPLGPVQRAAAQAFIAGMNSAPVSVPRPAPQDRCAGAVSPEEIVACNRDAYGDHLSKEQLYDLMHAIARTLNAKDVPGGPWGVLNKTFGNYCTDISCDIICAGQGSEQRQYDVLRDERFSKWDLLTGPIRVDACRIIR